MWDVTSAESQSRLLIKATCVSSAACNTHGVFVLSCTPDLRLRRPLRAASGRKVLTSKTFCFQQQMREDSAAKRSV